MFHKSKYTNWYFSIVNNAKNQNRVRGHLYYENHHIIPISIGGKKIKANEVFLTAKEHYVCHRLLIKMVINPTHKTKMAFAFHGMRRNPRGNAKRYNSRLYEHTKKRINHLVSGKNNPFFGKGHFGEENHFFGKTHTDETRKKISVALTGKMVGEDNPFFGKEHSQETKDTLRIHRSIPITVTFNDGSIVRFPCKRDLGLHFGKTIHLGLKLNKPQYKHLWKKYGIIDIMECKDEVSNGKEDNK